VKIAFPVSARNSAVREILTHKKVIGLSPTFAVADLCEDVTSITLELHQFSPKSLTLLGRIKSAVQKGLSKLT